MKMDNQYWQKTGLWYYGSPEMLISCSTDLFRDYFCPWGRIFASVCYKSYFWRSGGIFPPFLLFRQLRGLRNQLRWGGMHLKLPGNQFWEVPTLFFFRRGSKKSCSGSFFATSWAGRRVCSDMQLTARLRRKRAATAKPINWRRNRKTSLVHSTHGFHQ